MNRETFAIGMTEYAGIAILILAVVFAGAFDLVRSRLALARQRRSIRRLAHRPQGEVSRSTGYSK